MKKHPFKNSNAAYKLTRRSFVEKTALAAGAASLGLTNTIMAQPKKINLRNPLFISGSKSAFEREPLLHSYGFKGGYITRLWQVATKLNDSAGNTVIGLGVQSPLWSDSKLTSQWGESGGNSIMYNLSCRALQMVRNETFESPVQLLDNILDEVHSYGTKISNTANLRKTFALNALVTLDNAAWLLYAKQNNITSFQEMIPPEYKKTFAHKNEEVASIPSISYSTSSSDIRRLGEQGYFFIKIKIGSPGTQQEMLEKDMERMELIHHNLNAGRSDLNSDKKIRYYLDANGRYEKKDTLKRLLDHCKKIKVYDQIAIIEEPFPESAEEDVSDLGVRIAADESAHTDKDALKRIEMGYTAIALKPMGKTMSMTLKIAKLAHQHNVPCFCTDLTVNPVLVDWNKCIASHLKPIPGQNVGLLETNGGQNYRNWESMLSYHPRGNARWNQSQKGLFLLGEDFYKESGGIFLPSSHYEALFQTSPK